MPDWDAAYDIMGRVLIQLGNHSEAIVALKKAVSYMSVQNTVLQ